MIMRKPLLILLPAVIALAGCGHSPPTRFYTLDAAPPAAPPVVYAGPPVRIGQVYVPAVLDRGEVVEQSGATQLKVNDFDHWGAPLGQLIRSALESDLNARLPAGDLLPDAGPVPDGTATIMITVLSVNRTASGLVMDVTWTRTVAIKSDAQAAPRQVTTSHSLRLQSGPVDASPQGYATGLSQMTGQLADAVIAY